MPDVIVIKRNILEYVDTFVGLVKSVVTPTMNPISPVKLEGLPTSKEEALSHLLWLCEDLRRAAEQEDFVTCRAHMSFIQGALWYMGREVP